MTVVASRVSSRPTRRSSLRRFLAWHPEWWAYAVAGAAWVTLLAMDASMSMTMRDHGRASWLDRWSHWLLMVLAMMLPIAGRTIRTVGLRSVWSRRHWATGSFVLGYVALSGALGAVLVTVVLVGGLDHDATDLLVVSLLLAAAWQGSVPRRRLVRRCASLRLGVATGLAGDGDCARAGMRSGTRCLLECWPAMIAMALSQSLLLMAGLTVVLLTERMRGANPQRRAGRHSEAWALAGFAGIAALAFV